MNRVNDCFQRKWDWISNNTTNTVVKFTGCRVRPSIDIPMQLLEQYLQSYTAEQTLLDRCLTFQCVDQSIKLIFSIWVNKYECVEKN